MWRCFSFQSSLWASCIHPMNGSFVIGSPEIGKNERRRRPWWWCMMEKWIALGKLLYAVRHRRRLRRRHITFECYFLRKPVLLGSLSSSQPIGSASNRMIFRREALELTNERANKRTRMISACLMFEQEIESTWDSGRAPLETGTGAEFREFRLDQ